MWACGEVPVGGARPAMTRGRGGVEERGEEEVAGKEMESDRVRRQVKRLPRGSSAGR